MTWGKDIHHGMGQIHQDRGQIQTSGQGVQIQTLWQCCKDRHQDIVPKTDIRTQDKDSHQNKGQIHTSGQTSGDGSQKDIRTFGLFKRQEIQKELKLA